MSINERYSEVLKKCFTTNEVYNLMKGRPIRKVDSKFEDKYYIFKNSSGKATKRENKLKNKFLDLCLRTLNFLKNDGYIGSIPQGSGKIKYHSLLQSILLEIETLQPNIKCMSELKESTIEQISSSYLKRTYPPENMHPITGYSKLRQLLDFPKYANSGLPLFMQLDASVFSKSESFLKLKKLHMDRRSAKYETGPTKEPYSLINLKTIMGEAIKYIENHSKDIFIATEIFVKEKKNSTNEDNTINSDKFYSFLYNRIKESPFTFKEPSLQSLQNNVKKRRKYKRGGNGVPHIRRSIIEPHHKLEASCIIIILMTTGMRLGEFSRLTRYPNLTNDDHYKLKRMVYKTASTEHGHEHTIPIPEITEKAITVLSKLSELKDGKREGELLLPSISQSFSDNRTSSHRPNELIKLFVKDLNIEESPTPHDFRHAMAFLIAYSNKKDGLELAREFLGHTSITMTLQYMGHYSETLKDAVKEMYMEGSKDLAKTITNELKNDKRLYGIQAENILGDQQFTGSYAEEFIDIIDSSLQGLIDKGAIAIIQTPVCICIHDLTSPEAMVCQKGFDIKSFVAEPPKPSKCDGTNCKNALFLESDLENINFIPDDNELKARLEKNKFFMDAGGFDYDPMEKIRKQHKEHQKRIVNG